MDQGKDCREGRAMKGAPSVIVHGLGRSGTSLAMQMLAAGGWPVVGTFPDYEVDHLNAHRHGARTSRAGRIPIPADHLGRAMKLLWPAAWPWGEGAAVAILATRDPMAQAESQVKLMRAALPPGFPIDASKRKLRQLAEANAEDTARARSLIQRAGVPLLEWPFLAVLRDPWKMAVRLSSFLDEHTGQGLNAERAAGMVIPRPPRCLSGMLEDLLIRKAEQLRAAAQPL